MNDQNLSIDASKASVKWNVAENASEPWLLIDHDGNLKYLDLKAGLASTDFQTISLARAIQSAILAEREACAKIAEKVSNESEICAKRSTGMREKRLFTGGKIACDSVVSKIRARSNALESPNKPLESSENLQSSTFPASVMKTCS